MQYRWLKTAETPPRYYRADRVIRVVEGVSNSIPRPRAEPISSTRDKRPYRMSMDRWSAHLKEKYNTTSESLTVSLMEAERLRQVANFKENNVVSTLYTCYTIEGADFSTFTNPMENEEC